MLVLKLEIWPGGNEKAAETLGAVHIENITGPKPADYSVKFLDSAGRDEVAQSTVRDYKGSAWGLVYEALKSRFGH